MNGATRLLEIYLCKVTHMFLCFLELVIGFHWSLNPRARGAAGDTIETLATDASGCTHAIHFS